MGIDKRWIVSLKGRDYPTWPGVLDAAHEAGLVSLTTELIQIPHPDNGDMAIVKATASFSDGQIFSDYGDCSPKTTTPMLAAAAIRLASTRAKGRVLRDAVNVGQTMLEELADTDDAPEPARSSVSPQRGQQRPAATAPPQRVQPPNRAAQPPAAPSVRVTEQKERGRRLKAEADALGVDVTPFRPDPETATPDDVDAMLTALETLIAEVREKQEAAAVAA
jgi:hypothetical protein